MCLSRITTCHYDNSLVSFLSLLFVVMISFQARNMIGNERQAANKKDATELSHRNVTSYGYNFNWPISASTIRKTPIQPPSSCPRSPVAGTRQPSVHLLELVYDMLYFEGRKSCLEKMVLACHIIFPVP